MIVCRRRSSGFLAILGISALVGSVSQAQSVLTEAAPRRPRGIYAVVSIAEEIRQQQKANPSIRPTQLHAYFADLYQDLLDNPTVSGLTLQAHWDLLNPRPPSDLQPYDWSYLDDAFSAVSVKVYFNGTPAASFFGAIPGPAPLNYLQIYSSDIQYAEGHVNAPARIMETGGASALVSAQDLLDLASVKLLKIAEPALPLPVRRIPRVVRSRGPA